MLPHQFTADSERPARTTDPVGWEKSWERDFARVYASRAFTHGALSDICAPALANVFAADCNLLLFAQGAEQLRAVQRSVAQRVTEACAMRGFEGRWRAAPAAQRSGLLLQAVLRVMETRYADTERVWCPDSTVAHLSSGGGEAFLAMMKLLLVMGDGNATLHEDAGPYHVPHPVLDRLCALNEADQAKPGYRALVVYIKQARARLLAEIVLETIRAFVSPSGRYALYRRPPLLTVV